MSVELQDQRKVYTGNGTATVFAFPFTIEEESQVKVVRADTSGTETTLTLGTDYTVTINATSGVQLGDGSVTLASALPSGYKLALVSNIPEKQERTFPNNTPYYQEQVEGGIDKNTRLIQQLQDGVDRALTLPVTSTRDPKEVVSTFLDAADAVAEVAPYVKSVVENIEAVSTVSENIEDVARVADLADELDGEALVDIATVASDFTGTLEGYFDHDFGIATQDDTAVKVATGGAIAACAEHMAEIILCAEKYGG